MRVSRYATLIIALLAPLFSGCITEDLIRSDSSSSTNATIVIDQFQIGYDGVTNLTLSQSFVDNSTHLFINGHKKELFYDYNETSPNYINITASLSPNDLVEVEYEKLQ